MIIDAHCHIGHGRRFQQSADDLIRQMDEVAVDIAVVCPIDRQIAVDNHEGNDAMIEACCAHPDRFRCLAVAAPWFGTRAEVELERALDSGLVGLKMHPSLQGHYVNDTIVDLLIGLVEQARGFVYVHLGTSEYSLPLGEG